VTLVERAGGLPTVCALFDPQTTAKRHFERVGGILLWPAVAVHAVVALVLVASGLAEPTC